MIPAARIKTMAKTKPAPNPKPVPARAPMAFVDALHAACGGEVPVFSGIQVVHGSEYYALSVVTAGRIPQPSEESAKRRSISFAKFAFDVYAAKSGATLRYLAAGGRDSDVLFLVEADVVRLKADYDKCTWGPA